MTIEPPIDNKEVATNNDFPYGKIEYTISYSETYDIGEHSEVKDLGLDFEIPCQLNIHNGSSFYNPTQEKSMKASEFLYHLDLSKVLDVVHSRYGNKEWHFRYPVEAMIKAFAFKYLKGLRWDTTLLRYFEQYPQDAELIGFKVKNGEPQLPSKQMLSHFVISRLRNEGLYDIFDSLVLAIREEMAKQGIKLGRLISIDSTPIKSLRNDPDAEYNPHYDVRGYKIHGAIDSEHYLPLAFNFTPGLSGDSPHYLPLLKRVHMLGINFEKILADGAYASFENFAVVNQHHRARTVFNLRNDATSKEEGRPEGVKKHYNKLWKKDGFKADAGIDYMLTFLMLHDKFKVVGSYYRNKHMKEWENNFKETKGEYNKRAGIEAFHGHIKQQMNIEKFFDKRGLQRAEMHVLLCYITLLCVALCRLQHGITEGLINVKCLV